MATQLEIVDAQATQDTYEEIFDYLTCVDEKFSMYKADSEISKINRGEISDDNYSDELKEVLALCEETSALTNGYFSICTPEGILDPSGLVKGWAIQNAAEMLKTQFKNFYIEIAGDIQTSGVNSEGDPWSIGIRNPFVEGEIVKVIYPGKKGIATSGTYLRGQHIYNPYSRTGEVFFPEFVSLTVVGPNVFEADRHATPVFVMGRKGLEWLETMREFEAYAITPEGAALMTTGFEIFTSPTSYEIH